MSKVLLINPPFNISKANYETSISVGLLALASYLDKQGIEVKINWYYHPDDEDMLEDGEIMSDATGVPFNFISTEDIKF